MQDWNACSAALRDLLASSTKEASPPPVLAPAVERKPSIPLVDPIAPAAPRSAGIPLVDPVAAPPRNTGIQLVDDAPAKPKLSDLPLVDDDPSVRQKPRFGPAAPGFNETAQARTLRDLLVRTLTLALGSLLQNLPDLLQEAEGLANVVREARTEGALTDASARLKQLCFRIELRAADVAEEHELLMRLFNLLLENISELLEDDSWLSGQIATVQNVLAGPINHAALMDAHRSLKEVIYKQGLLKHSLSEAKVTVKNMMITFIDRLGEVAATTDDYHKKIDGYAQKISEAKGIPELNTILHEVMRETKHIQAATLRSRDDMMAAKQAVQDAEARVQELENQLQEMSELVKEDQLTGSLNRRGLDDVFEREVARAERKASPLCIALLDLDDFKRLNDTYGHSAGDEALIHLVRVVKDTLRTMDVIGRFGGEEFLVVMPDTPLDDATRTVVRLQRELTKRIFMYEQQKLLVTFSAGVALRQPGEDQAALIKRADAALYRAKREGKNRVIAAD
ncbi:diguanylate cyclase [Oxalobacteraceae bacterium OM1]|nr:diguanylate cyclase [Oxalobacteraceae bacterium OM1]